MPEKATLAQLALRWILSFEAVSTIIPGAKTVEQARANWAAPELPEMRRNSELYQERIAPLVRHRW